MITLKSIILFTIIFSTFLDLHPAELSTTETINQTTIKQFNVPFCEEAKLFYSASSTPMAAISSPGKITIWNLGKMIALYEFNTHQRKIDFIGYDCKENKPVFAVNSNGGLLAYEEWDRVSIWQLNTNEQKCSQHQCSQHIRNIDLKTLSGRDIICGITMLALSTDSKLIACSLDDNSISILNIETGELIYQFSSKYTIIALAFNSNSTKLAYAIQKPSLHSKIKVLDLETMKPIHKFNSNACITALEFVGSEGKYLAALNNMTFIELFGLHNGTCTFIKAQPHNKFYFLKKTILATQDQTSKITFAVAIDNP